MLSVNQPFKSFSDVVEICRTLTECVYVSASQTNRQTERLLILVILRLCFSGETFLERKEVYQN